MSQHHLSGILVLRVGVARVWLLPFSELLSLLTWPSFLCAWENHFQSSLFFFFFFQV